MVQKICTETSILNCSSLLLSFEIANQVLAHHTEAMTLMKMDHHTMEAIQIFSHIKGAFLMAEKYFCENIPLPQYTYVQINGSWWFMES